jgi:hypothetical protein
MKFSYEILHNGTHFQFTVSEVEAKNIIGTMQVTLGCREDEFKIVRL